MTYAIVAWLLVGYWCAGAWIACVEAVNRFAGVHQGPASTLDKVVGVIMGMVLAVGGPFSLLVFRKKKGETEEDKFTGEWMGQIKQSFLHPRKTNWVWPMTIVLS